MAKDFTPHPYQDIASDFMCDTPRGNLWAGMGMGKTSGTLMALDILRLTGGFNEPTLVLGPKRVARDVWANEVVKWNQFKWMNVAAIVGDERQRLDAIKRKADLWTCNYEQLPWLVERLGANWPFRMVIADESTRLKGFRITQGGQRAHSIAKMAHAKVDRWINLSGTPAPKGLEDLWGQQWYVDRGATLGRTHTAFMQRWFQRNFNGYGVKAMPHAEQQIKEFLKPCTLTLDPKDWFELKDPIERTIEVTLPPAARKAYAELERTLFTMLESGTPVEVFNEGSVYGKCRQIANGGLFTKHPAWEKVHDEKVEALKSIVEEANGAQVLIAYEFIFDKELIQAAFPKAVNVGEAKNEKLFKAGKVQLGYAHPASMGHGVDGLQEHCNILARFGHTQKPEDYRQMLERIGPMRQLQSGKDRNVWVYNIVAANTVEEAVIARHAQNLSTEDALRAYMKRSKS